MELMWKYADFRIQKALDENNFVPKDVYQDIINEMRIRGIKDVDIHTIIQTTLAYKLDQIQKQIKKLRNE